MLATNKCSTKSSSRCETPLSPLPPRFCSRYSVSKVRLMYPLCEMVITTSSLGIKSSILISSALNSMLVLLSSPYFSAISRISDLIMPIRMLLSERISSYSLISLSTSSYSARILSISRPVNR